VNRSRKLSYIVLLARLQVSDSPSAGNRWMMSSTHSQPAKAEYLRRLATGRRLKRVTCDRGLWSPHSCTVELTQNLLGIQYVGWNRSVPLRGVKQCSSRLALARHLRRPSPSNASTPGDVALPSLQLLAVQSQLPLSRLPRWYPLLRSALNPLETQHQIRAWLHICCRSRPLVP
jgi:hypothetical protein